MVVEAPVIDDKVAAAVALPERARRVGALAREHADFGDRECRLAEPVVDALHREGLFGMWVPRSIRGGSELGVVHSLEVIENLSYGDPSTGWVLMAAALAIGTGAAYLGEEAVGELFGHDRLPVIAGQGTRPGRAVPRNGGYALSGSWSFASGIRHGTHIHTLGVIEGVGEPRIFVLPVERATLIDNWDVLGLRGTGSIDYTTDNVLVPEAYTHFATTETPCAGEASMPSGSLDSRPSVTLAGHAGLAAASWTNWWTWFIRRRGGRARWPTAPAFRSSTPGRRPYIDRRVRSCTKPGMGSKRR
jgi:indole-3-acetate monooxygenase